MLTKEQRSQGYGHSVFEPVGRAERDRRPKQPYTTNPVTRSYGCGHANRRRDRSAGSVMRPHRRSAQSRGPVGQRQVGHRQTLQRHRSPPRTAPVTRSPALAFPRRGQQPSRAAAASARSARRWALSPPRTPVSSSSPSPAQRLPRPDVGRRFARSRRGTAYGGTRRGSAPRRAVGRREGGRR